VCVTHDHPNSIKKTIEVVSNIQILNNGLDMKPRLEINQSNSHYLGWRNIIDEVDNEDDDPVTHNTSLGQLLVSSRSAISVVIDEEVGYLCTA